MWRINQIIVIIFVDIAIVSGIVYGIRLVKYLLKRKRFRVVVKDEKGYLFNDVVKADNIDQVERMFEEEADAGLDITITLID